MFYVYIKFIKQKNNIYYNNDIKDDISILYNYKHLHEYTFNKCIHHINRFYFYMFSNEFEKMQKHYELTMEYLKRLRFRIENDIERENAFDSVCERIEIKLIQYLYLIANDENIRYNNLKQTTIV